MKPLHWNLLGKMSHITNSHSLSEPERRGLSNSLLRTTRHVELETKCTSKGEKKFRMTINSCENALYYSTLHQKKSCMKIEAHLILLNTVLKSKSKSCTDSVLCSFDTALLLPCTSSFLRSFCITFLFFLRFFSPALVL